MFALFTAKRNWRNGTITLQLPVFTFFKTCSKTNTHVLCMPRSDEGDERRHLIWGGGKEKVLFIYWHSCWKVRVWPEMYAVFYFWLWGLLDWNGSIKECQVLYSVSRFNYSLIFFRLCFTLKIIMCSPVLLFSPQCPLNLCARAVKHLSVWRRWVETHVMKKYPHTIMCWLIKGRLYIFCSVNKLNHVDFHSPTTRKVSNLTHVFC